jgi:hypothetical protein
MKRNSTSMLTRAIAAVLACLFALPSAAMPPVSAGPGATDGRVVKAASDCYAVAQQMAAQEGGQVVSVSTENRGGQMVCVIVVLVPGQAGERPRRAQFVVPAG